MTRFEVFLSMCTPSTSIDWTGLEKGNAHDTAEARKRARWKSQVIVRYKGFDRHEKGT